MENFLINLSQLNATTDSLENQISEGVEVNHNYISLLEEVASRISSLAKTLELGLYLSPQHLEIFG